MKCTRCGRPMLAAAFELPAYRGRVIAYGPKCARLAGLTRNKQRAPTIPVRRVQILPDERQADWVMEAAT